MVLKVIELFVYDMIEEKMFYVIVVTEIEFFRVKVFDIVLKEKFILNKVFIILNYVGCNGFINIYSVFSVLEVNDGELMNILFLLRKSVNRIFKINYFCLKRRGIFVNGVFIVCKVSYCIIW